MIEEYYTTARNFDKLKKYNIAYEWLKSLATLHYAPAIYDIGCYYYNGYISNSYISKQNKLEAIECFKQAAELDYFKAQHRLGKMYYSQTEKLYNPTLSIKWHNLAINNYNQNSDIMSEDDRILKIISDDTIRILYKRNKNLRQEYEDSLLEYEYPILK